MVVLAAFLAVGFGIPMTFASEPSPRRAEREKGYDQQQGGRREEEGREEGHGGK